MTSGPQRSLQNSREPNGLAACVLGSLQFGIVAVDADGNVVVWNAAARKLLGPPPDTRRAFDGSVDEGEAAGTLLRLLTSALHSTAWTTGALSARTASVSRRIALSFGPVWSSDSTVRGAAAVVADGRNSLVSERQTSIASAIEGRTRSQGTSYRYRGDEVIRHSTALLESAPDAAVIVDETGTIMLVNAHMGELFGYPREELIGKSVETLLPERFRRRHVAHRAAYHADQSMRPIGIARELTGRRKDGTEFEIEISLSAVQTKEGQLVTAFVRDLSERKLAEATSRDLTAHLRIEAELKRLLVAETAALTESELAQSVLVVQLDRMEEVDRLKDEFVAVVTHELRTPLTAILGYAQTLLEEETGALSEMQRRFLSVIDRNSRRLVRIVDDLLFIARVEAGGLELKVETVDLGTLVEEAIDGVMALADANGVTLELRVAPLPHFEGDSARLSELVENLAANALKFTLRGGSVTVDLREADGRIVLEVADTGIGIPADEQPHLFDRFYRASSATEHQIQGTGLGLTIVKSIVEAHGGDIALESEEDVGTTFRIVLPTTVPPPRRQEPPDVETRR